MENNINIQPKEIAAELLNLLEEKNATCAIYKDGAVLTHKDRGVSPIIDFWSVGDLENAIVCDKVIGKASAMFLVSGGAKFVHGKIMSQLALDLLASNNVDCSYTKLVPKIQNRQGDGLCPMESAVANIEDLNEGIELILKKVK